MLCRDRSRIRYNEVMKIGIDARFYGKAGPGRYAKNILQELENVDKENQYIIFMNQEGYDSYHPRNPNFKKYLANNTWYSFDEQIRYFLKVLWQNLDLYYVPHFNIPILYPKKIVTAIPDMTMHTFSTESATTLPKPYFLLKKLVYRFVFWWALFRSTKVIVPSEAVRKEFIQTFKKFPPSKFVLAPEGVDPDLTRLNANPEYVLKKYGIEKPYILHVGSMYVHKNVDGVVEMFKILRNKYGYKGKLVLVSKIDKFSKRMNEKIEKEGLVGHVILPAFKVSNPNSDIVVSDDEVSALRTQAQAYVFASFAEGFSLTALESMIYDLPCAISRIPVHEEVHGDSVLYFDPYDPQDMAKVVNELLTNEGLRKELIKKGHEQVKKYNWRNTAEVTLSVFNNVLKNL